MSNERLSFLDSFKIPLIFVAILWIIKIVDFVLPISLVGYGVLPRSVDGLLGILTYPLIHGDAPADGIKLFGDFAHVFNNSFPLIVLGWIGFLSYRKVILKVVPIIWIGSGALVWLLARQNWHIGASGVVYGLAFFIFFSGVFRKDIRSIALSLFVAFWYGGMVWGVFPIQEGVSWEGHLFGAIAGVFAAYLYRKVELPKKKVWDEEPEPNVIIEEPFWVKKSPEIPYEQEPEVEVEAQEINTINANPELIKDKEPRENNSDNKKEEPDIEKEFKELKYRYIYKPKNP